MARLAFLAALAVPISAAAHGAENPGDEKSIGVATMLADRTILVGVSGPEPGSRARAVLMVEPGDTNYQSIIDHVGGLKPGETKPIPPWPDSQPAPAPPSDRPMPSPAPSPTPGT
jgi:hypothetical protein